MNEHFGWIDGTPPPDWPRVMAMDVGGATPNALEWFAQDPESLCLVAYDEINETTTDMRKIAMLALPKMKHPSGVGYNFLAKVIDYENRIAADDMAKHGIRFTNAVKQNKTVSIHRLAGYLHPNPKRPFPIWHPNSGKLGSPLLFITSRCKTLIKEIPIQKWKNERVGDSMKDEMDRSIRHDSVDCALYVARIMPAPVTIPVPKIMQQEDSRSLQSKLYWADVKAREQWKTTPGRKPYNPTHGGSEWKLSLSSS